MWGDESVVRYEIVCDPNNRTVRLAVTGFDSREDAMAFADWLSQIPFDNQEEFLLH